MEIKVYFSDKVKAGSVKTFRIVDESDLNNFKLRFNDRFNWYVIREDGDNYPQYYTTSAIKFSVGKKFYVLIGSSNSEGKLGKYYMKNISPINYEAEKRGKIIYIQIHGNENKTLIHCKIPARIIWDTHGCKLICVKFSYDNNDYDWGLYRYYFLKNGKMYHSGYTLSDLYYPLPSSSPTQFDKSVSDYIDITDEFPFECLICLEKRDNVIIEKCKHIMCKSCCLVMNNICPVCRTEFNHDDIYKI
jgi:hypothetical protein